MTGLCGTFVDIDASGEAGGETRCAFALAVAANLCGCAIRIRTASRTTSAVNADFTGQTVVVAVTNFDATSGDATFSSGAVVVFRAGRIAAIRVADGSGGTVGASGARNGRPHASLLSRGSSDESLRALALCGSVDDLAQSVDSAHSFALTGALAFVVETGLIGRTVAVGSTSGDAGSGDAGLAHRTLAVCQTEE